MIVYFFSVCLNRKDILRQVCHSKKGFLWPTFLALRGQDGCYPGYKRLSSVGSSSLFREEEKWTGSTGMQITADHLQLQSVVLFQCTKKYQWLKNRIISCFFFSIRNDYPDVTVLVMSFIILCVAY